MKKAACWLAAPGCTGTLTNPNPGAGVGSALKKEGRVFPGQLCVCGWGGGTPPRGSAKGTSGCVAPGGLRIRSPVLRPVSSVRGII